MRTPSLLLVALCLGACGESPAATGPGGGPTTLAARDRPLETGEIAPAFAALPEGRTSVLVFYRGAW